MRLNDEINSLIEKQQKAFSIVCKATSTIVQDKVQACGGKSKGKIGIVNIHGLRRSR